MSKVPRVAVWLTGLFLLPATPARAQLRIMVTEVFPGYASAPDAQFVELQMFDDGQQVLGQSIQLFDRDGFLVGTPTFNSMLPNAKNQATILIATAEAQSLFGVTPDLVMAPLVSDRLIDPAGGMVCYASRDCVSWGDYVGMVLDSGRPFRSDEGLPPGQSAQRRLDRGNPTLLDEKDDTDDSATDFRLAPPTPRNNAGIAGATAGYASTPAPSGTVSFGSVAVGGTLPATLEITETGGQTLTVSNPSLGGANRGDFSVDTDFPLSLPNGSPPKTVQLGCTPHALGVRTATLTLTTNDPVQPTVAYSLTCTGSVEPPPLSLFSVVPCRVVDTRDGGGPVAARADRTFTIAGTCGVPAGARAVSLNVTVTGPTAAGNLRLFPAGSAVPLVSAVNYVAGQTRANNAVIGLSDAGQLTVRVEPSGSTHVILDVNGYFE